MLRLLLAGKATNPQNHTLNAGTCYWLAMYPKLALAAASFRYSARLEVYLVIECWLNQLLQHPTHSHGFLAVSGNVRPPQPR
jgi:hypothetical protein